MTLMLTLGSGAMVEITRDWPDGKVRLDGRGDDMPPRT